MRKIYLALLIAVAALPARAADFKNWAAVVVAADNRSGDQKPSEVFDNGRRDIAALLLKMGFAPDHVIQFSVQPQKYPSEPLLESTPKNIADQLYALNHSYVIDGCFIYMTSHGSPAGIWVKDGIVPPPALKKVLQDACGTKPTVAFISACYSGVFVLDLMADNRFLMTAARRDRTSFGCGATNQYTFFDSCFLRSVPGAGDFEKAGNAIKDCVATNEKKIGVEPSEPQLVIGYGLVPKLPTWMPIIEAPKPDAPAKKPAAKKPAAKAN